MDLRRMIKILRIKKRNARTNITFYQLKIIIFYKCKYYLYFIFEIINRLEICNIIPIIPK